MLTLAIDSTANTATCALCENGKMLSLFTVDGLRTHSETLLPMIENMLKYANKTVKDVDLFACAAGPGSFTGVRIGASLIKGLAFDSGKPCVGVSSLEALAYNVCGNDCICVPVMDARRSQVYTALFEINGDSVKRLSPDELIPLTELEEKLSAFSGKKIIFTGDGYTLATEYFNGKLPFTHTPDIICIHNAFSVALLAEKIYRETDDKSVFNDKTLSPKYLRASQAERERAERLNNLNK